MQKFMTIACTILAAVAVISCLGGVEAAPYSPERPYYIEQLSAEPDLYYQALPRNKRDGGLDFGLSRGASGAQMAKYIMALEAANSASGPGRRRRSDASTH